MGNLLKETDIAGLEKYRLRAYAENSSFTVADLLDKTYLVDFMKRLADSIGAPTVKSAASIFIKRYAFLAVISLFSMSENNTKLNLSLDNIEMENPERSKDWLPMISFKKLSFQKWNGVDRDEWRKSVYRELFANNIYPLIEQIEKTFNLSKLILWENIAVYLFWLYETELKNSENSTVLSDFRFLVEEAEGKLFGRYNHNPLSKYYSEKIFLEEFQDEVRIRKTCCFTYQLDSKPKRCKTCPCTHIAKDGRCHDGENICATVGCIT
jgi:ferric iron reductase protein FhuF